MLINIPKQYSHVTCTYYDLDRGADGVATHLPMTPAARVQLPGVDTLVDDSSFHHLRVSKLSTSLCLLISLCSHGVTSKVQGWQRCHLIQKLHTLFCLWFTNFKAVSQYSRVTLTPIYKKSCFNFTFYNGVNKFKNQTQTFQVTHISRVSPAFQGLQLMENCEKCVFHSVKTSNNLHFFPWRLETLQIPCKTFNVVFLKFTW